MRSWLFAVFAALVMTAGQLTWPAQALAQWPEATREVPEYRLGSGDKLRVITFGEDSLTGEFYVGGSGKVSLPLIGEVDALGATAREFQARSRRLCGTAI